MAACSQIGSTQIRNRATIGGNIVNAAPCADSVPPLIAYNAKLKLQSKRGVREIPAADFILKNYQTQIQKDEILVSFSIPKPAKKYAFNYFKLGRRKAVNITRISIGILISYDEKGIVEECKIVSGSLFSKPKRIPEIERIISGKPLSEEIIDFIEKPLREIIDAEIGRRWSSEYKIPVFINMCQDALREMGEKVKR